MTYTDTSVTRGQRWFDLVVPLQVNMVVYYKTPG